MLVLSGTTNTLKVQTLAAYTVTAPAVIAAWREIDSSNNYTAMKSAFNLPQTNNQTDIVTAPSSASAQRVIDFILINNRDSVANTFQIWDDTGGVQSALFTITLQPGEILQYTDKTGFFVSTSTGAIKQSSVAGVTPVSSAIQINQLASDVVNSNATANTIASVTGLSFAVTNGLRYWFRFFIRYTSAAGTTGSRWSVSGPGAPTELCYRSDYSLTTTTRTLNDQLTAYDLPAASNASSSVAGNIAIIEGIIQPSSDGNVIARFASEVASSAITAKAGSFVEFQQL